MATQRLGNITISYDSDFWAPTPDQTQLYNALGRTAGANQANADNRNFFQKRWDSIENALGSTGAAAASFVKSGIGNWGGEESDSTARLLDDNKAKMNEVVKRYGYNSLEDYYNALDDAEVNDKEKYNTLLNTVQEDLKTQSAANMDAMKQKQEAYKDYVDNNYVSNKLKQDRGKFAGSAINTLSTAVDIAGLGANPLSNAIQGGVEGIADELEQNGLENFDWDRARQNAIIGAATGAVTGAFNKGVNKLAKSAPINGGKGLIGTISNIDRKLLNYTPVKSNGLLGQITNNAFQGALRGGLSGGVGGATGAGLSAYMNGGDVMGSAFQGLKQGIEQGVKTGGIMGGANTVLGKMPGIKQVQAAKENWDQSGKSFNERLTNTLNSGDSAVGNWINGKTSRLINSVGNVGNSVRDNNVAKVTTRQLTNTIEEDGAAFAPKETVKRYLEQNKKFILNNKDYYYDETQPELYDAMVKAYDDQLATLKNMKDNYVYIEDNPMSENEIHILPQSEISGDDAFSEVKVLGVKNPTSKDKYVAVNTLGKRTEYTPEEFARLLQEYDNTTSPKELSGNSSSEVSEVLGRAGDELLNIYETMHGGEAVDPYNRASWEQFDNWLAEQRTNVRNAATPTTAKGWLKKAGERIVEDANDRGVGLGIKDVNDQYSDDIRKMEINGDTRRTQNAEDFSDIINRTSEGEFWKGVGDDIEKVYKSGNIKAINELENAMRSGFKNGDELIEAARESYIGQNAPVNKTLTADTLENWSQLDAWDRLAQQKGYNNYDDVIKSYMEANPGVELNPRGAAGQILTWLDENPNTPTTAAGWAKKAGQRVIEDANKRGVGLSLQDVSQENPGTEVYRTLTGQTEQQLPEVFEPEARNQIEKRNKWQSVGDQMIDIAEQQKYSALYDTLDEKTAQRAIKTNAPQKLANMGVRPEDYLESAKTSNYVNKVVSDLAEQSKVKINMPDLAEQLEKVTRDYTFEQPNNEAKYRTTIRQIVADGNTPDEYSAKYLIEQSRELGDRAAGVRGNSEDAINLRNAYTDAKRILRNAAADAVAEQNYTGKETNAKIAEGLRKMGANEKIVEHYTKPNADGSDPTLRDYIYRSSDFEQAREMGTQMNAHKYEKSASSQPTNWITRMYRASGLDQPIELLLKNTVAPIAAGATKLAGKTIKGVGNVAANIAGDSTPTATPTTTNTDAGVIDAVYNPATQIYNAIGRTEGSINAQNARTADYLTDAAEGMTAESGYYEPLAATNTTMPTTESTALYNSIYGSTPTTAIANTYSTPTFASQEEERAVYFFPPTGDYWTDMLSRAMRRAKNAEDYKSLGSLYEMYQDSLSKLQKQSSSSSEQKLTATQQRANAAMTSLERLATMTPDLGYNLSNIPVIGNIATLGGNDYESEARSLAQQIGYMVSGSNIKDTEAENIGKSYVPQPWDREQTRQNKLRRAYDIIQQYQNGYAAS